MALFRWPNKQANRKHYKQPRQSRSDRKDSINTPPEYLIIDIEGVREETKDSGKKDKGNIGTSRRVKQTFKVSLKRCVLRERRRRRETHWSMDTRWPTWPSFSSSSRPGITSLLSPLPLHTPTLSFHSALSLSVSLSLSLCLS